MISIRSGSRSTANSQSRYTLVHEYLTQQRLRSGFYSVLLALYRGPKYTYSDYPFRFLRRVYVFLYYRTGQSSRFTLRDDERNEGPPAIRAKDLGKVGAKGPGHVPKSGISSIRARTTGKNAKEHYRRYRKDDEGRLTGVAAKRQRQIENYLVFFLSYNNTILRYIITMMYLAV